MPRYDRQCRQCGHSWESVERMHAAPRRRCPACGKRSSYRVPSPATLVTDTNLARGVVKGAAVAGFRIETRADLKAMEAKGYGVASKRDLEQAASASSTREVRTRSGQRAYVSKRALECARDAQRKMREAGRITIRGA